MLINKQTEGKFAYYNVLQLQEVGDYESDRRSGTKLSATTKFDTKYKASFNH
jgi:predicted phage-related endonuclease